MEKNKYHVIGVMSGTSLDGIDLVEVKNWITSGGRADVYIVIAQTDREKGSHGINAFIVEKGTKGFHVGPKEDKLGIRGSDTHTLQFNDLVKNTHKYRYLVLII